MKLSLQEGSDDTSTTTTDQSYSTTGGKSKTIWAICITSIKSIKFKYVKLAQIICGLYALIVTFALTGDLGAFGGVRDPITGMIQSSSGTEEETEAGLYIGQSLLNENESICRTVITTNIWQSLLLCISRFSAFSMYPVFFLVMFTKYRATQAFLDKTPLSVFLIQDTHALHVYCGWYIFFDSIIHTITHLLRWADQNNMRLLWSNDCNPSGITGMIAILSILAIVLPMTIFKKLFKFEMRKYAHYFFWVFLIALTWHAPFWSLPNAGFCNIVFPTLAIWYGLDATYVKFWMSEKITTVDYKVLNSGIELSMPVSDRFQNSLASGGYGYVMAPWVDKHQWHAFSIYENPLDSSCRHMFIAKAGDWTTKMHEKTAEADTSRPLWVCGPFPSPYNNCSNFDNMICVASGVGITPALSAIENYRESRRCNLIWSVRDASILVFFLENAKLDEKALNLIFYTGKDPLPDTIENYNLSNAHVEIIKGRANISCLIPNIINYFENPDSDFNKFKLGRKSTAVCDFGSTTMSNQIDVQDIERGRDFSCASQVQDSTDSSNSFSVTTIDGPNANLEQISERDDEEESSSGAASRSADNNHPIYRIRTNSSVNGREFIAGGMKRSSVNINTNTNTSSNSKPYPAHLITYAATVQSGLKVILNDTKNTINSTFNNNGINRSKPLQMQQQMSPIGQPEVWEENEIARAFAENQLSDARRETWGLMYCGARNPLLEHLSHQSKNLHIPLHEEAFDW